MVMEDSRASSFFRRLGFSEELFGHGVGAEEDVAEDPPAGFDVGSNVGNGVNGRADVLACGSGCEETASEREPHPKRDADRNAVERNRKSRAFMSKSFMVLTTFLSLPEQIFVVSQVGNFISCL